jgi:hypothetical protein
MKSMICLIWIAVLATSTGCSHRMEPLPHRYLAGDNRTVLTLRDDGEAEVEDRETVRIVFPVGEWVMVDGSIKITDAASGERLEFTIRQSGQRTVLTAKNLADCPSMVGAWKMSSRYVSLEIDSPPDRTGNR